MMARLDPGLHLKHPGVGYEVVLPGPATDAAATERAIAIAI